MLKIEPTLSDLKEEELEELRQAFYEFGQLMFDDWRDQKFGSKYPLGSLTIDKDNPTM